MGHTAYPCSPAKKTYINERSTPLLFKYVLYVTHLVSMDVESADNPEYANNLMSPSKRKKKEVKMVPNNPKKSLRQREAEKVYGRGKKVPRELSDVIKYPLKI